MKKIEILPGERYGRLVVLKETESKVYTSRSSRRVDCSCSCGNKTTVLLNQIRSGKTRSCGCLKKEEAKKRTTKIVDGAPTSEHPLHKTWANMKQRCANPNNPHFKNYGGRGLRVDPRWLGNDGFPNFVKDMGSRPKGRSLDRIDNSKGYGPKNCKWSTRKEQNNNARSNTPLTHGGTTLNLTQWAIRMGIHPQTLRSRLIRSKWPIEKALTTEIK